MATIAVFEVQPMIYSQVDNLIAASEHKIIAAAASTPEAHILLTRMALREVQADYTLVDGSLSSNNSASYDYPAFRFVRPGTELPMPERKKWYQRSAKPLSNPAEIVINHEGDRHGADGRFILRVIESCNIATTTINLSGDVRHSWDADGLLDREMGKQKLLGLLDIIAKIEASKNNP